MTTNVKPYASFNRIPVLAESWFGHTEFKSLKAFFESIQPLMIKNEQGKLLETYSKFQKDIKSKRVALYSIVHPDSIYSVEVKITKFY